MEQGLYEAPEVRVLTFRSNQIKAHNRKLLEVTAAADGHLRTELICSTSLKVLLPTT
jgi:hypothetical protein